MTSRAKENRSAKSEKDVVEQKCYRCGATLTEENSLGGGVPCCIPCQKQVYEGFRQSNGTSVGLYLTCARFDLPCLPLLVPENFEEEPDKWGKYLEILTESGKIFDGDEIATFSDGEMVLLRIFGKNFDQKDFSTYVRYEMAKRKREEEELQGVKADELAGTEKQRKDWGTLALWQNLPMTDALYNELDRIYEQRLESYKGIMLSDATQMTLRRVCKLTLAQDFLQSRGDASGVDRLQKTIDSMLASEQLRKKDEKPVENFRLDTMIKALENAGLMENGQFLDFDRTREVLLGIVQKNKKYDYPLDACDQIIFKIANNIRQNAGSVMMSELSDDLLVSDDYGEFKAKGDKDYEERAAYAQTVNVRTNKEK